MDYVRIGEKVISIARINNMINEILELRCKGYSQQEVSKILDIDRTFISRLESMGEVRKGGGIAVVGFPIENKDELEDKLKNAGVDYILLMSEDERNDFVRNQGGQELFNGVLELISEVRKYRHCIIIGSNMRTKLMAALLDGHVYTINIGESPIKHDVYVAPERVLEIVNMING